MSKRAQMSSKFCQIRLQTGKLSALEHLKIYGENVVLEFSQIFLIRSFPYLQGTRTYTRAWMSLKFGQI